MYQSLPLKNYLRCEVPDISQQNRSPLYISRIGRLSLDSILENIIDHNNS